MAYPPGWPRCACGWPARDGHLTCGRRECDEAAARTLAGHEPDVFGGQFYERTPGGKLAAIGTTAPRTPDVWICRRVADYPGQRVPAGGAVAACSECQAAIVFNPRRAVDAPKICLQCGGITPCPIES